MRDVVAPTLKSVVGLALALSVVSASTPVRAAEGHREGAEVVVQATHTVNVTAAAFTPDSRWFFTFASDGTLRQWEVGTHRLVRILQAGVWAYHRPFSFSADGRFIVMLQNNSREWAVWDIDGTREILRGTNTTNGGRGSWAYGVAATEKHTIVVNEFGVSIYDRGGGEPRSGYPGNPPLPHVAPALSPSGAELAVLTRSGLGIVDLATGTVTKQIPFDVGRCENCGGGALAYQGNAVHFNGPSAVRFDLDSMTAAYLAAAPGRLPNECVSSARCGSADGKWVAQIDDASFRMWSAGGGGTSARRPLEGSWVNDVTFVDGGRLLGLGGYNNVEFIDLTTGKSVPRLAHATANMFSPGAQRLAKAGVLASKDNDSVTFRSLDTGRVVSRAKALDPFFPISLDGRWLFQGGEATKAAKLARVQGGVVRAEPTLDRSCAEIEAHAFSPDNKRVAIVCTRHHPQSYTPQVYQLEPRKKLPRVQVEGQATTPMVFDPKGNTLVFPVGTLGGADAFVEAQEIAHAVDVTTGRERWQLDLKTPIKGLAYSPDGKLIAVGGTDGRLVLADATTGAILRELRGHTFRVLSLSFSEDGKRLASGGWDATTRLWDVATGDLIATIVFTGGGEHIIYTPDNYYTASKGALDAISFRVGNRVYPFGQFDLQYNRPDIVLQRLGLADVRLLEAYRHAYAKRLKRAGFTEAMFAADFHLPEVVVDAPPAMTTKEGKLRFNVEARDTKYQLDRMHVYVNDVPLYGSAGRSLRKPATSKATLPVELELSAGPNEIRLSVLNEKGVESLSASIVANYEAPATLPKLVIVAIGVSKYADGQNNLAFAAKDAHDIVAAFTQVKDRFSSLDVISLTDADVTLERVAETRARLAAVGVDDEVIVFFAGHGLLDDKLDYYLATADVDFAAPAARGLPYESLEGLLDGIASRRKLLLVDACHSGELDKEDVVELAMGPQPSGNVKSRGFKRLKSKASGIGLKTSVALVQDLFADLSKGSGARVISSASGTEYAFESASWQNGVFTYALLESFRDKRLDVDESGRLSLGEIRDFVVKRVVDLTNGQQTPTSRRESVEFDFDVY